MPLLAWVICAVAAGTLSSPSELKFDEIRKTPAKFNLRSVTVTGIIEVDGSSVYLWRDVAMREREDWESFIRVYPDLSKPTHPDTGELAEITANLRWVRVTGVVDTSLHWRFGIEPFGIRLERLEVLPRPRLKQFLPILAWFRNETGAEVELRVIRDGGETHTTLGAGEMTYVRVMKPKGSSAVFVTGKKVSARLPLLPRGKGGFYDAEKRACYFRITKGAIQPAPPSKVSEWKFVPTPGRD